MLVRRRAVLLGLLTCIVSATYASKIDIKINLGGNAVAGFSAEEDFLQLGDEAIRTRFHGTLKGTSDDLQVFQTQRFAREEDLVINVPVPDGVYDVTLMFAETWEGAYEPGKRVFDVYVGSKPGGVIKVAEGFDPFQVGGPAGPVRQKYTSIAIQDGLTVALRPIKQNAQIAGIVISGFSYNEALLDNLPTVPGDVSEMEDFSVLSNIGPRPPLDPSMLYDPKLNPKFQSEASVMMGSLSSMASLQHTGRLTSSASVLREQSFPGSQERPAVHGVRLSSASDSMMPKAITSQNSQPGYGQSSLPRHPAPQLVVSRENSPATQPGVGFVRAKVEDYSPSHGFPSGKSYLPTSREPHNFHSPFFAHPIGHQMRHLTSIPIDADEIALLASRESTQSKPTKGSHITSSVLTAPSPTDLSGATEHLSVVPQYSDYTTNVQKVEHEKEASSEGHILGYSASLEQGAGMDAAEQKSGKTFAKVDGSVRDDGSVQDYHGYARILRQAQAQAEPVSASSLLSTQMDSSPSFIQKDVVTASTNSAMSMVSPPRTTIQDPALRSQTHSHPSASYDMPESVKHHPQDQSDQKSAQLALQGPQEPQSQGQVQTHNQNFDQRSALTHSVHVDLSSSMPNEMARERNSKPESFEFLGDNSEHNSREGIALQEASNGMESLQATRTNEQPNSVFKDPISTRLRHHEQDGASSHTGMIVPGTESTAFSRRNVDVEKQIERPSSSSELSTAMIGGPAGATMERIKTVLHANLKPHDIPDATMVNRASNQVASVVPPGPCESAASPETDIVPALQSTIVQAESGQSLTLPSGVPNVSGKLDGHCLDNSTHCSCGMAEDREYATEECLFIIDEKVEPMICRRRPCSGKLICACAPSANSLCHRTTVNNILVRVSGGLPEGIEDPGIVSCMRQTLEHGIVALSPII